MNGMNKKEIRKVIRERLTTSLADFRSLVGEKRFEGRIKKAAKQFSGDISKHKPKKQKAEPTTEAEKQ
jgi:hypothetical protein